MIAERIQPSVKTWATDRLNTVGASEVGKCARRVWWDKHDPLPETGRWGPMERGNVIEAWVIDRLKAAGLPIEEAQRTLVRGFLSATVDALLADLAVEIKSFAGGEYPGRRPLPLHAHLMQVQAQIGLWNEAGGRTIIGGLLLYINAADFQDIREFPVDRDEATYAVLKDRARRIMSEVDPLAFPPEGRIAGGKECRYCQYNNGNRCK
jgi:CRISPR/Cas system-associated exonuclease Cas4 (RecB family)